MVDYSALETGNMMRVGDVARDLQEESERWHEKHYAALDRNDSDFRQIGRQVVAMYRETREFARVGPMFGVMAGSLDIVGASWRVRIFGRLASWLCWHLFLVGRPGGNDFLISRWMLSRRVEDRDLMISRLAIPGPIGASLYRALFSLCEQFPQFREEFRPAIEKQGPEIWREFWESIQPRGAVLP